MKCFLDLDGVLVNFVGGACRKHRRPNPYSRPESLGEWDCVKLIGMAEDDFWRPLDFHFWRLLDWMPDGREILDLVEDTFGPSNVCLLTSPADNFGAVEGKRAWIKKHLPGYYRRTIFSSAKEFMAGPDRVLIDDYVVNVDRFTEAGGLAMLVPRPWNRRHNEPTLETIQSELLTFDRSPEDGKENQEAHASKG